MESEITIGIVVFDGADELDVVGPYRTFAAVDLVRGHVPAPNVHLELVAEEVKRLRFASGLVIEPTTDYASCPPLDVLVVPGGGSNQDEGRRKQQTNEATIGFVRAQADKAKLAASVCTGAFLLAAAGLLADRRGNTHWFYREELAKFMEERDEKMEFVPERVVWDEPIVTSGGVTSGIELALSIIEKLCGTDVRRACEAELEIETPR